MQIQLHHFADGFAFEDFFEKILKLATKLGAITGYTRTEHFDAADRRGIDFLVTLNDGEEVVVDCALDIKRKIREHKHKMDVEAVVTPVMLRKRNVQDIPEILGLAKMLWNQRGRF